MPSCTCTSTLVTTISSNITSLYMVTYFLYSLKKTRQATHIQCSVLTYPLRCIVWHPIICSPRGSVAVRPSEEHHETGTFVAHGHYNIFQHCPNILYIYDLSCRRFSAPSLHSSIIPSNEETYKRGLPSTILVYWSCSKSTVRVFPSFFFADVICFSFSLVL